MRNVRNEATSREEAEGTAIAHLAMAYGLVSGLEGLSGGVVAEDQIGTSRRQSQKLRHGVYVCGMFFLSSLCISHTYPTPEFPRMVNSSGLIKPSLIEPCLR